MVAGPTRQRTLPALVLAPPTCAGRAEGSIRAGSGHTQAPRLATSAVLVLAPWSPDEPGRGPGQRLSWRHVREIVGRGLWGGVAGRGALEEWSVAARVRRGPGFSAHSNQRGGHPSQSTPVLATLQAPLFHKPREGGAGQAGWHAVGGAPCGQASLLSTRSCSRLVAQTIESLMVYQ